MLSSSPPGIKNLSRLADKPVLIRIKDHSPTGTPSLGVVHLHRQNRVPEVLSRSFVINEHGEGTFYGWMPVDLKTITVTREIGGYQEPLAFNVRKLSYIELFVRLSAFAPKTIVQTLRLLAVGNIRGFEFRIVRLLDSMTAPTYEVWRKLHRPKDTITERSKTGSELHVLYSIVGDGAEAEKSRVSLRKQTYKSLMEIEVPANAAIFGGFGKSIWMRVPAGLEFDEDAVSHLVKPLKQNDEIVAVYCDEDYPDPSSRKKKPFFKPAFNAPLAQSGWLAPDGAAIRSSALPVEMDLMTAEAGDLLLAASKKGLVAHLPLPLVHRPGPRAEAKRAIPTLNGQTYKVSVIIPTRDRADLMARCLHGLFHKTKGAELDVIVIDNDSTDPETLTLFMEYETKGLIRRLAMPGIFNFAKACNLGMTIARHELVLLLNNDVEPLHDEWLEHMAQEMDEEEVGACGALLLFPDGYIQHGGVTLGAGSVARHSFHFRHPLAGEDHGLINQRREVSAVTAACLLTRKTLWQSVKGMNEQELAVAFNDVDYCLKIRTQGHKIIWTPHARLTHLESVSRRADDTPEKARRFAREEQYMHETWGSLLLNDPFYNPNLSLVGEDYSLDAKPRNVGYRTPISLAPSGGCCQDQECGQAVN